MLLVPSRLVASTSAALGPALSGAADLLLPRYCCFCSAPGSFLCDDCRSGVLPVPAPYCSRCCRPGVKGLCPDCDDPPEGMILACQSIRAISTYEEPLSSLLHQYKYAGMRCLAGDLARMLEGWLEGGPFVWQEFDALTWVPPSTPRRLRLGYDHSGLLARRLSRTLALPLIRPIARRRGTPQVGLSRDARVTNARRQFHLRGPSADLEGMRILLIDDVVTTGATVHTVAGLLRSAGASEVRALVLARNA